MEPDVDLARDADMALYCEVLLLYLLVGSAMGPCSLERRLGQALDSRQRQRLIAERRNFQALPEDVRTHILEGDPTLATLLESARSVPEPEALPTARPASA